MTEPTTSALTPQEQAVFDLAKARLEHLHAARNDAGEVVYLVAPGAGTAHAAPWRAHAPGNATN